ncbi:MAG: hypothetical protein ACOC3W_02350 [Thermodesulfobacteriota bacterium]
MSRINMLVSMIVLSALFVFVPGLYAQQTGQGTADPDRQGMMGSNGGGYDQGRAYPNQGMEDGVCPYCGREMGRGRPRGYGMGRGMGRGMGMMNRGQGRGMMMQRGQGRGQGMMRQRGRGRNYGSYYDQQQLPLEKEEARGIVENYLESSRNPNLRVGDVEDQGDTFQADIVTKDGSLVDQLLINKDTGWMRSVY